MFILCLSYLVSVFLEHTRCSSLLEADPREVSQRTKAKQILNAAAFVKHDSSEFAFFVMMFLELTAVAAASCAIFG